MASAARALGGRRLKSERLKAVARVGHAYSRSQAVEHESGARFSDSRLEERMIDDDSRFPESIADEVRRDFEVGDIVSVDGWVLSATEATTAAAVAASGAGRRGIRSGHTSR
jgi:hypothetical protein